MSVEFSYEDIEEGYNVENEQWHFTAAMVISCEPLLNDCYDNYDVARRLKKAGVIDSTVEDDTESCQLWCYFNSKADGESFIDRLNEYLVKKHTFREAVARF
jgi:benzoyl-CoA reductase/2-hydroxyglutaryl-CoA dehydratase subunit BcrC/BadD/HgdB